LKIVRSAVLVRWSRSDAREQRGSENRCVNQTTVDGAFCCIVCSTMIYALMTECYSDETVRKRMSVASWTESFVSAWPSYPFH
jgi:hypothetical protein